MRTRVASAYLFVVCMTASAASVCAEDAPRLKFREGETLRYLTTIDNQTHAVGMGRDVKMDVKYEMAFTWRVAGVDADGVAEIDQTTDRMRFVLTSPEMNFTFDSADKEHDVPADFEPALGPLLGTVGIALRQKVSPQGEILSIDFPEAWLKATGLDADWAKFAFERDKPLKRLGELGYTVLPNKALAVDETEEIDRKFAGPLSGEVVYVYKFTRQADEQADGHSLEKTAFALAFEEGAVQRMMAKRLDVSGSTLFDPERGVLVRLDFEQVMEANVAVESKIVTTKLTRLLKADEDPFAEKPEAEESDSPAK